MPLVGRGADWQMSGNDLTNDRNQPHETLIDAGNVGTLKPAWTFKTLGSVSATPLVTGGYVYVPDWGGGLHKLNARTGEVAWSRKVSEYTGWSDSVSRTTPVLADGVLVVAQQPQNFGAKHDSSYLLGLDPETGNFLWKVMLDKHPATILTQSPVVYDGVIYVGTSSNEEHWAMDAKYECCSFVGSMAAVDLKTGQRRTLIRSGGQAEYVEAGYLVYAAADTLRAVGGKATWGVRAAAKDRVGKDGNHHRTAQNPWHTQLEVLAPRHHELLLAPLECVEEVVIARGFCGFGEWSRHVLVTVAKSVNLKVLGTLGR
jgi:hypothetical protein